MHLFRKFIFFFLQNDLEKQITFISNGNQTNPRGNLIFVTKLVKHMASLIIANEFAISVGALLCLYFVIKNMLVICS